MNMYYMFGVTAINVVGESNMTISHSILTATVPGVPQQIKVANQTRTWIQIAWSDPIELGGTTLNSYVVEMDGGSSGASGYFKVI